MEWLRAKLIGLTAAFQAGVGAPAIFEAQFLAYLECLVVQEHGVEASRTFWQEWQAVCRLATPKGQPVTNLSHNTSRDGLLEALLKFQKQYDGPHRRKMKAQSKPRVRSTPVEVTDLFDLFGD